VVVSCDAGFYTVEGADGTDFYIQGLCPERPEIWIKAPLKDGKVVFPASTYFGETWLNDPPAEIIQQSTKPKHQLI